MSRDQRKQYISSLLRSWKLEIPSKQTEFFEAFLDEAEIESSYNQITASAKFIMENWKERSLIEDIRTRLIQLPNATVGKPYSYTFSLAKMGLQDIAYFELAQFERIGLTYDKETHTLSGAPTEKGEHKLIFRYRLAISDEAKPLNEKEILFVVNPDPKSLWKDLPSDKDDQFYKEDTATGSMEMLGRKLVAASKRGRSHAHEGKFRDDDFDFAFFEDNGFGVIVVADGAGSAKFSRKGSQIACETTVEYFRTQITPEEYKSFDETVINFHAEKNETNTKALNDFLTGKFGKAPFAAHKKIQTFAEMQGAALKDFSTTLICCLVKKYEFGWCVISFGVGDGGAGIYMRDKKEALLLTTPDGGEFAGQTRFLTMPDIFNPEVFYKRISFKLVDDLTALILMTDGVTDPKFQTDANLARIEKWDELWDDLNGKNPDGAAAGFDKAPEETEKGLLAWLDFWSPGNHDDRTIAILH